MEFLDVVRRRRTTNGAFLPDRVSEEHQRLLMEVAGRAPSQLNSQPWRFVIVEERATIEAIARISGESMTEAMSNGTFFERYKPYFRFSKQEMERRRDGMLFDRLPAPLRPFTSQVFTSRGQKLMNAMRVPHSLGEENRKLVLWLTTVEIGMGIQFISFPMEVPGRWDEIVDLLKVPEDLELMAVYRLGYLPPEQRRPPIDWTSEQRRLPSQYVFRGTCATPQEGWDG
jgi:nitroreductase